MRPTIERTFVCPDLTTQSDEIIINQAMNNTPCVVDWKISLSERNVHVVLGDVEGETSVRRHLADAGFPPED